MTSAALPVPAPMTPPLKWAGGKRWLGPALRALWEQFEKEQRAQGHGTPQLVEPFGGSLAVALQLRAPAAVLNDLNTVLIGLYREVALSKTPWDLTTVTVPPRRAVTGTRAKGGLTVAQLTQRPCSLALSREKVGDALYYAVRDEFNRQLALWRHLLRADMTPVKGAPVSPMEFTAADEAAIAAFRQTLAADLPVVLEQDMALRLLWDSPLASRPRVQQFRRRLVQLFYYLLRTCFNGVCRFGPFGFNVPYGKKDSPLLLLDNGPAGEFAKYHNEFRRWTFTSGDYRGVLGARDLTQPTFLYVDPPYDTPFTKYAATDFLPTDQVGLVRWLQTELQSRPQHTALLLSNEGTDFITTLYAGQDAADLARHQQTRRVPLDQQMGLSLIEQLVAEGYAPDRLVLLGIRAPRRVAANGNRDRALEVLLVAGLDRADVCAAIKALPADLQYAPQVWDGTGWQPL